VQGSFCAACGTPAAAAAPGAGGYAPPPPATPVAAGLQENVACALCYLVGLFTGILFLVLEPYSKNRLIRFHAFQSIFLHLGLVAFGIVLSIVMGIFFRIPVLGTMFAIVGLAFWPIFGLACLIVWLMLMYKAYNNQKWVLPIIGPLAEKQAQG
jgi:uncharacterized membrane protein